MVQLGLIDPKELEDEFYDELSGFINDSLEDIVDPDNEYFVSRDFSTIKGRQKRIAIAAMAVEYLRDHDWRKAAARANIPQSKAKDLFEDRLFLQTIHELLDIADPHKMIQLQHIIAGLMREANGRYNSSSERTTANKELARLLGYDPSIKIDHTIDAPIINIIVEHPIEDKPQHITELNEDGSIVEETKGNGNGNGSNGHKALLDAIDDES